MRISEYEYYDARANQEHLANQDDELTNEMAQVIWDSVTNASPTIIQSLTESQLAGIWDGAFNAAKNIRNEIRRQ
ncbi:hypothetical protein D0Z62_21040 [Providencia rettgeri]|uniref:hypothetical protein n=1 Tax=Providencia rettgeri TaxID=587 RepID=UPI0010123831|nr:hypothetical protein [Providencia rettgeri]RXN69130.1 hypothetical protein D0Z62_21040 [Providencia rettgeri]BBV03963.1 hypothetical protein BML2531_17390 [Providencia rettgeri]